MILTYHTTKNLYFKLFASLTDKIANTKCYVTFKNMIPVFGNPNKMVLNFILGMTAATVFHTRNLNPTPS